jgi:hypothetical protein
VSPYSVEHMSLMSKSLFDVPSNQWSAMLTVRTYIDTGSRSHNLGISNAVEPISLKEEYLKWGPEYVFHSSSRFSASAVHPSIRSSIFASVDVSQIRLHSHSI